MAKRYGVLLLVALLAVVIVSFALSDTGDSLVFLTTKIAVPSIKQQGALSP